MRLEWSTEDLVGSWTLVDEDRSLIANKTGATRLGFALLPAAGLLPAQRFPSLPVNQRELFLQVKRDFVL